MSSSTVFYQKERTRYWEDEGVHYTTKHQDDEVELKINWEGFLAASETVSSATYTDSGVTTSGKSVSSPETICTVTGLGYTDVEITTSNSRTAKLRFEYLEPGGIRRRSNDYRF